MKEFKYEEQELINEVHDKTYTIPTGAVYPTFFVGVGGAGTEILEEIQKFLFSRPDYHTRYDKLVQFIGVDTDMGDLSKRNLKYKFLISDFPKGEYVRNKLGKEYKREDPFFTQWWPTWYTTRPDSTKGAGQIRVESRLALHYQLEDDRGHLIKNFTDAIVRTKDHDNPYRVQRPPLAYCHLFCSLAGGTGSGGFLPLAYLLRDLLQANGLMPIMVGHFLLPTMFYRKVRERLHNDIKANGYAALKELEWFMTLGYNNNPRMLRDGIGAADDSITFNYNPYNKPEVGDLKVTMPPFNLVNVIDEPGEMSFSEPNEIYPAIAGCAYVQLFSPIISARETEEDNYYKKIKHLDERSFSLNYGTYGLSTLVLPDKDILDFCENEMVLLLTEELGGGTETIDSAKMRKSFMDRVVTEIKTCKDNHERVRQGALVKQAALAGLLQAKPKWGIQLAKTKEEELVVEDVLAKGWPNLKDETGLLQHYDALEKKLSGALAKRLSDWMGTSGQFDDNTLPELSDGNPSSFEDHWRHLHASFNEKLAVLKHSVDKEVEECKANVDEFFTETWVLFGAGDSRALPSTKLIALSLIREEVERELLKLPKMALGDVSSAFSEADARDKYAFSFFERLLGEGYRRRNDDWNEVRREVADQWGILIQGESNQRVNAAKRVVFEYFEDRIKTEMQKLRQFAPKLAAIAKSAKRTRADLLERGGSSAKDLVLRDEVLFGIRSRKRLWDRLFRWLIGGRRNNQSIAEETGLCVRDCPGGGEVAPTATTILQVEGVIEAAHKALRDKAAESGNSGRELEAYVGARLEGAIERALRDFCRRHLVPAVLGRRQAGDDRFEKGLMLDECLELEARWELETLFVEDHLATYSKEFHAQGNLLSVEEMTKRKDDLSKKFEPKDEDILRYIREKIMFVANKSRVLAKLRITDDGSIVDPLSFVCVSKHYADSEERSILKGTKTLLECIQEADTRLKTARVLDEWTDEKKVIFYNARIGLPVYAFDPVNREFKEAYERVYRDYVTGWDKHQEPIQDFPSHIDTNFEDPKEWDPHAVLPSLLPGRDMKKIGGGIRAFSELIGLGFVKLYKKEPKGHYAELDGVEKLPEELGTDLKRAIEAGVVKAKESDLNELWYIHCPQVTENHAKDPILAVVRSGFRDVLGDRLDRAFERYQEVYVRDKSNRRRSEQMTHLVATALQELAASEETTAEAKRIGHLVLGLREELGEIEEKIAEGKKIHKYYNTVSAVMGNLKELYAQLK